MTPMEAATAAALDSAAAGQETPVFSLELTQDQKDVREWVHGFAEGVVRPAAHTVAVIVPVPATAQRDGHPTAAAGGPDGDRRGAPRDGGRANPVAPDERHREAWRLASAGPAGRAIGCDDAAPLALAQRR